MKYVEVSYPIRQDLDTHSKCFCWEEGCTVAPSRAAMTSLCLITGPICTFVIRNPFGLNICSRSQVPNQTFNRKGILQTFVVDDLCSFGSRAIKDCSALTSSGHSTSNVLLVNKNLCNEVHPSTSVRRTPFKKTLVCIGRTFIGLTEVHDRIRYTEEEEKIFLFDLLQSFTSHFL